MAAKKTAKIIQLKDPLKNIRVDLFNRDDNNSYKEFQGDIQKIKKFLKLATNSTNNKDFLIMASYVYVIAAMEFYLSKFFIAKLLNDKNYIIKFLEYYPKWIKKHFKTPVKAFTWIQNLDENLVDVLNHIIFHDLNKARGLYKKVLNIEFPRGEVFEKIHLAVNIRHDIVHRIGRTKKNVLINLKKEDVEDLIMEVTAFIRGIENQAYNR